MTKTILGNFVAEKNGKRIQYRTEIATEDYYDAVLLHMCEYFLAREPLCSFSKLKDDPISVGSVCRLWRKILNSGTVIIALLENDTGEPEKLIGCNLTYISSKNDADEPIKEKGEPFYKLFYAMQSTEKRHNIYEKYNVDSYLSAFGLSVHPNYHGYEIGKNILKSREPLAKKFGLRLTGTVFSAGASKYLAGKLGYKTLEERLYTNLDVQGEYFFKDMEKVMNERSAKCMIYEFL